MEQDHPKEVRVLVMEEVVDKDKVEKAAEVKVVDEKETANLFLFKKKKEELCIIKTGFKRMDIMS
jgi:hypothetical protein